MEKKWSRLLERNGIFLEEEILWKGNPSDIRLFRKGDLSILLMSIFWFMVLIYTYSFYQTLSSNTLRNLMLVIVWLLVIRSINIAVFRLYVRRYKEKNTLYFITESRVLMCLNYGKKEVRILWIGDIKSIKQKIGISGLGALLINYTYVNKTLMKEPPIDFQKIVDRKKKFIMYDLASMNKVYDLIQSLR